MKYDLVVIGGGTAGVACAYTAGKLGIKTLLIEKNTYLGGTMTASLVVPAMKTSNNSINNDFYNELYSQLASINGAITYEDGNKGWFNPELLKIVLDKMLKNANVDILLNKNIKNVKKELSSYIVTIEKDNSFLFKDAFLSSPIETRCLVDATGNGKICEILNCDFIENKNIQPVNLRFILSGVDTNDFANWIMNYDSDRNVTTACKIDDSIYLSTAYTWDSSKWALKPIFEKAIADGVITEEDSNYFQLFSVAGTSDSIAFNAPRILDTTNLSETEVYIKGREAVFRLFQFCKKYLKGFEKSHISSIANSLGIRISRCVKGKYVYKAEDLKSGKKFENPVVISNYPIDVHSDKKDSSKLIKLEQEYQLPIESLIVNDNLFVIGRCLSAEFEAQAALRIIPSCFSMGEGLAKHIKKHLK